MTSQVRGTLLVVGGLVTMGAAWHLARREGNLHWEAALAGPACVVFGLADAFIPAARLYPAREVNGRTVVDRTGYALTPLGWAVLGVACAASGLFAAWL